MESESVVVSEEKKDVVLPEEGVSMESAVETPSVEAVQQEEAVKPVEKVDEIERLMAADYLAAGMDLTYIDVHEMHALYEKIAFRSNLILSGPKGCGKSLSIASFARKNSHPLITYDCSEDVRRSHLLGMFVLRGDRTPFVLGPITTAFEVANEYGTCILCLEEVNALSPQMQKVLNAVTDFRRKVEVPEAKRVFRLGEGKKIWIVGTMNFSAYGGVYQLNEDLKSRFRIAPVGYPKQEDEIKILLEVCVSSGVDPNLVTKVILLCHETRTHAFDYELSTRDAVQIVEDAGIVGIEQALWLISGKFESEDRATFSARVSSIFTGVDLTKYDYENARRT